MLLPTRGGALRDDTKNGCVADYYSHIRTVISNAYLPRTVIGLLTLTASPFAP